MTKSWPYDHWPPFFRPPSPKTNFRSVGARHYTPQRPRTCSQTKKLATAALTAPQCTTLFHTQPQPTVEQKQEEDLVTPPPPPPPPRHPAQQQTTYHPIIANLRPQYPTIHEGLLEDLFPLIRSANLVTDPGTGKQLEYRQLINHPDSKLCQLWQRSSEMNLDDSRKEWADSIITKCRRTSDPPMRILSVKYGPRKPKKNIRD